jgi:hypothetical protein
MFCNSFANIQVKDLLCINFKLNQAYLIAIHNKMKYNTVLNLMVNIYAYLGTLWHHCRLRTYLGDMFINCWFLHGS